MRALAILHFTRVTQAQLFIQPYVAHTHIYGTYGFNMQHWTRAFENILQISGVERGLHANAIICDCRCLSSVAAHV